MMRALRSVGYVPRHKQPVVSVEIGPLLDSYLTGFSRHLMDGRTVEDADALARIDADDALTAWAVSVP